MASSCIQAGNSGFLPSCKRELRVPNEFQQGNQALAPAEAWDSAFLSSCKRGIRPPVKLRWGAGSFLVVQQRCRPPFELRRNTLCSI